MADGSQTIDRLQVEIALDTSGLSQSLQSVNSQVDSTKTKLASLETSSCSTAGCVKSLNLETSKSKETFSQLGSSTASASKSVDNFGTTMNDSAEALRKFNGITKLTGEDILDMASSSKKAADDIEWIGDVASEAGNGIDWIPDAADQMGKLGEKTQGLGDKAKTAATTVKSLKGGLAALGITAGITAIINKFKEMAEKAREANDAYDNIKKSLISFTGDLNEDQLKMVDSIYVNSPTSTGFTDRTQVTKAVGSSVTLWKDASLSEQQNIATEFSTLQALGRISDTGAYAQTAKGAFAEWGIGAKDAASSMEYLYYVSQQTGVGMDELTSFLDGNAKTLQTMGYSFQTAAQLIGNSFNSVGKMDDISEMMSNYETNYENKLDELKKDWNEKFGETEVMDQATLNKYEKQAEEWATAQGKAYSEKLKDVITQGQKDAVSSSDAWKKTVEQNVDVSEQIRKNKEENKAVTNPTTAFEYDAGQFGNERERIRKLLSDYDQLGFMGSNVGNWVYLLKSAGLDGTGFSVEEVEAMIHEKYGDKKVQVPAELTLGEGEGTATENATKQLGLDQPLTVPVKLEVSGGNIDNKSESVSVGNMDLGSADKDVKKFGNATEEATPQIQTFTTDAVNPLLTATQSESLAIQAVIDVSTLSNDYSTNTTVPTLTTEKGTVNALEQAYWDLYRAKLAAASV